MVLTTLRLSNRCPFMDALEVFRSNSTTGAFGPFHQFPGDLAVYVPGKSGFLLTAFLQKSPGRFGSFPLEPLAKFEVTFPQTVQMAAGKVFPVTIGGNVFNSKVYPQEINRFFWRWLREIDDQQEIKHVIHQNQIGLPPDSTLFDNPLMVGANDRGNFDSPLQRHKGNLLNAHIHVPLVVDHRTEQTKRVGLLRSVCPVSLDHFSDCLNRHLGRKPEPVFHIVVAQLMYLDLTVGFVPEGDLADEVACFVEPYHGFFQDSVLFFVCD
jgi:hypothetical protein